MFKNNFVLIWALVFATALGCSKSPKEYNGAAPVQNKVQDQNIPTFEKPIDVIINGKVQKSPELISQAIEGEDVIDAKKAINSRQPIIYGNSVAGITLRTTLQEAELILTPPPFGVSSNFTALYEEGIYIQWRKDEPQIPDYILVLDGYLGEMQVPLPGKPIKMKHDFSKQYGKGTKQGAESLARDYFRYFEQKESDYDCIAEATCRVIWDDANQKDFFFEIPGRLIWMISKDRFVLFRMLLSKANLPGVLASNIDLLEGEFLVSETQKVSLGATYESVEKLQQEYSEAAKVKVEPDPKVYVDKLTREYDGVNLGYMRTNFERKSETPQATDPLQYILAYGSFTNAFLINGKVIFVTETATDVQLTLEDSKSMESTVTDVSIKSPLVLQMGLKRENVKMFVDKLTDLLKVELQNKYPQGKVAARIAGLYKRETYKDYTVTLYGFDTTQNEGLYLQFTVGEEQGNIYGIYVSKIGGIYNSLDAVMVKAADASVEKTLGMVPKKDFKGDVVKDEAGEIVQVPGQLSTFTQLAGLKIGETVKIKNWDLGRSEANLLYTDGLGKQHDLRVPYYDRDAGFYTFDLEVPSYQNQATVLAGTLGAEVGLKLISTASEEAQTQERVYRILNIKSSYLFGSVKGLCGSTSMQVSLGMSADDFKKMIQQTPGCESYEYYREDGTKALLYVYFPSERIRFDFDEDALDSVTIYAREDEVK